MRFFNNLKYFAFAIAILGCFANFAQNEYGMAMVNWCTFFIGCCFLGELAMAGKELWKYKFVGGMVLVTFLLFLFFLAASIVSLTDLYGFATLILYFLLAIETFIISLCNKKNTPVLFSIALFGQMVLFLGAFMKIMHWPLSGMILIAGGAIALVTYLIYALRELFSNPANSTGLRTFAFLFLLNVAIGSAASVYKNQHWTGSKFLFLANVLLTLIFLIAFLPRLKFRSGEEQVTLAQYLRKKQRVHVFLFVYMSYWGVFFTLQNMEIGPKFYTLARHAYVVKLLDRSGPGDEAAAKKYQEAYDSFVDHYYSIRNN